MHGNWIRGVRRGGWRMMAVWGGMMGVVIVALGGGMAGCEAMPRGEGEAGSYSLLYRQGQYEASLEQASSAARRWNAGDRDEAAYVAGLSALRLGRLGEAERYLRQATLSQNKELRGDALANLGLVHYRLGHYDAAARDLSRAAELTEGEDRAQAYFHAGQAQQRLGRWPQARTSLLLARNATRDPRFRERVNEQLAVTGYTIQVGAFGEVANAQRAAQEMAGRVAVLRYGSPRLVPARSSSGESLTLVQVGTFSSYHAAHEARTRLGVTNSIIVPLANR